MCVRIGWGLVLLTLEHVLVVYVGEKDQGRGIGFRELFDLQARICIVDAVMV